MKYKGNEIGYKRTVGAASDLSKIAPGGKIERMGELFAGDLGATVESGAQFLAIMNKWYEQAKEYEQEGYTAAPAPLGFFMTLDISEYSEELGKAMAQFNEDDQPTIEAAEDPDVKKNDGELKSNSTLPGISFTEENSE